jgi:hypothetical protein
MRLTTVPIGHRLANSSRLPTGPIQAPVTMADSPRDSDGGVLVNGWQDDVPDIEHDGGAEKSDHRLKSIPCGRKTPLFGNRLVVLRHGA